MKIIRHCFRINDQAGFGDFLRGTYGLWVLCRDRGYLLKIYICHPLLRQIIDYEEQNLEIDSNSIRHFDHGWPPCNYHRNLQNLIRHIESPGDVINVSSNVGSTSDFTNLPPMEPLAKEFFKSILKMTTSFQEYFNNRIKDVSEKFSILQVRLSDPVGPRHESLDKIKSLIDRIPKDGPFYIISTNPWARDTLASIYGFQTLGTQVCHVGQGEGISNMDKVKETMTEFFLCSKASRIYQICLPYGHTSGFTVWTALAYDIPFQRIQ